MSSCVFSLISPAPLFFSVLFRCKHEIKLLFMCLSVVLSSDDEENADVPQNCSQGVHTIVAMDGTVIQGQISQEALDVQQEASDIQDMQVGRMCVCVACDPQLQYNRNTTN